MITEFIRNLLMKSAMDVVTNEEILSRSRNSDVLYKKSGLPKLTSLADVIDI